MAEGLTPFASFLLFHRHWTFLLIPGRLENETLKAALTLYFAMS